MTQVQRHHHLHSPLRRGLYSLTLVILVLAFGTIGIHILEGFSYLDSFYFISMIATGQGPTSTPQTPLGKLFVAFMAFISVGSVVAALGFVFGPFFGKLLKIGIEKFEEEIGFIKKGQEKNS